MSDSNGNGDGGEAKRVQSPDQGHDPSVEGPSDPQALGQIKMTGEGAPGSHSAVFGLTPDGQKHTETNSTTTAPRAAHSGESAVGGGKQADESASSGNPDATAGSSAGVADQINDPGVQTKGHGGAPESSAGPGEKPGAGGLPSASDQGTGKVGQESGSAALAGDSKESETEGIGSQQGGSLLDKAKSYIGGGNKE